MWEDVIEIAKNISAILGCIISVCTLCGICIKPLRKKIVDKISQWSNKDAQDKAIELQQQAIEANTKMFNEAIKREDTIVQDINEKVNQLVDMMSELSERVFRNEADRLRSGLFDCGNRCRRGIPLSGEEFRHIQSDYKKYSEELHCNGIGEDEYNFIKDYFNSQVNQDKLNKKYDD